MSTVPLSTALVALEVTPQPELEPVLAALSEADRDQFLRPLPDDFDPNDCLSESELAELRLLACSAS